MFVRKNLTFRSILVFSGGHLVWLVLWSVLVVALYEYAGAEWLSIPWVPLAVIGTAVAFYVGFKNNSAYDRLWEARKIWGAIVNDSRSWGAGVRAFVTDQFRKEPVVKRRTFILSRNASPAPGEYAWSIHAKASGSLFTISSLPTRPTAMAMMRAQRAKLS